MKRSIRTAGLLSLLALALAACPTTPELTPPAPPPPPTDPGKLIEGTVQIGNRSAVKLRDGRVFMLERAGDRALYQVPPDIEPQGFSSSLRGLALPERVDLSAFQTPIKNQGGRGTCTSFAAVGALEAALKRGSGRVVDLSEQFMAHVQKMNYLHHLEAERPLPNAENQLGSWYGGGAVYNLSLLGRGYGLPGESAMPYVGSGDFENTDQDGDVPRIAVDPNPGQRAVNDFNLGAEAREYRIPAPTTMAILPQSALDGRVAKVFGMRSARGDQLRSLEWFKTQLAASREVAFGFACCDGADPTPDNGIWNPAPDAGGGGHAMLMIGYDDRDRSFLIKNSWGDAGFFKWSYDWVTRGLVYEAATILTASDPDAAATTAQLLLGRWNLNFDGRRGLLDIYHIPGSSSSTIDGRADRRLGTFFADDGSAYRVNGVISGNRLEFYMDFANPNLPFPDLSGAKFTGYLFTRGHLALAGKFVNGSSGGAFHATKGAAVSGVPTDSFLGTWVINRDGNEGVLTVLNIDASTGVMRGSYNHAAGTLAVSGSFDAATGILDFDLPLVSGMQRFTARRYSRDTGLMAGTFTAGSLVGGFYAHHVGTPPTLTLSRFGFTGTASLNRDFQINASVTDPDGPTDCCTITWSPTPGTDSPVVGGRRGTFRFTTAGDKVITATARDASGNTVTQTITVSVINNPPVATMSLPATNITVFRNQPVTFTGFATDQNEGPGPDPGDLACNRLSFRSSSAADSAIFPRTPTGTAPNCTTTVSFTTNGTRSITLVATDSQGLENFAPPGRTITVVDPPANLPPNIRLGALPPTNYSGGYAWDQSIPITASATDPEGNNPVQYRWTATTYRPNSATVFAGPTVIQNWSTTGNLNWTSSVSNPAMFGTFADFGNACYDGQPVKLVLEARDSLGNTSSITLPNITVFRCILI